MVGLLLSSLPAWGQAHLGDQLSLDAAGSISAGYSGSFTNEGPSDNGVAFGGIGNVNGSYHSPQFLSFDFSPFYNQSRNDSTFQSITDSSGISANTTIFGGSKYPGYVNYSRVFNTEGNYFVPGISNYRTNGDSQTIGVAWGFNPNSSFSLRTGCQEGDNNFTVYGMNGENYSHFRTLFASAVYTFAGFRMGGGVNNSDSNNSLPSLLGGGSNQNDKADTTNYNFNLSHILPLKGNTWLNLSRTSTDYNTLGTNDNESTDVVTLGVVLKPLRKLSTDFNADYDDNLAGTIYQAETSAGVIAPLALPTERSNSWGVSGEAQYALADHLYLTGNVSHREELFLGSTYDSTAYSGDLSYGRDLWGGKFTTGTIVSENSLGEPGESMLGVLSNVTYVRKVAGWNFSGAGGYSRNAQTILVNYTTSGYNYAISTSHRLGHLYWNGSAGGSKSILNGVSGSNSMTQSYSTALSSRRLGGSVGYSRSSGIGLFTSQGITSLPTGLPPSLLPTTVLYGGTSYSAGLGGTPIRGLIFSGTFVKSKSNTDNSSVISNNDTEEANIYVQYKVRKIFLTAGYSRLVQGFTASGANPAMVSTYYVGLSRWFNFF
jgi:hypothetical protein